MSDTHYCINCGAELRPEESWSLFGGVARHGNTSACYANLIKARKDCYDIARQCLIACGGVAEDGVSVEFLRQVPDEMKAALDGKNAQIAALTARIAGLEAALKQTLEEPDFGFVSSETVGVWICTECGSNNQEGAISALEGAAAKAEEDTEEMDFFRGIITTAELRERAAFLRGEVKS